MQENYSHNLKNYGIFCILHIVLFNIDNKNFSGVKFTLHHL